jgi:hypothetical protein
LIRYFEQRFLNRYGADLRGLILEISEGTLGHVAALERSQPHDFDCVLIRALHLVYEPRAVLASAAHLMKPAAVLLALVPCISPAVRRRSSGIENWRFTEGSLRQMCAERFEARSIEVHAYGNVFTAAAALQGLRPSDLTEEELEQHDPDFPVVYGVRALKTNGGFV